jgi:hypothetical protein
MRNTMTRLRQFGPFLTAHLFVTAHVCLAAAFVFLTPSSASAAIVTFDGVATSSLPYTEAGLTFTNLLGTSAAIVAGGADGSLTAGTNTLPIHVHVAGSQPFNLVSLDIENIFRTWKIQSSSGAIFSPTAAGTINFTGMTGWSNLTSFDLIHDPGEANGTIRVDNISFTSVPEPSAAVLVGLAVGSLGFGFCRRSRVK